MAGIQAPSDEPRRHCYPWKERPVTPNPLARMLASFRLRSVGSVVVLGALAGAMTIGSLGQSGRASSDLNLSGGTAWFADRQAGYATLLDGATRTRVSYKQVAAEGDDIDVVQSGVESGAGAYVVDHTTGEVTPIDGATLGVGKPAFFGRGDKDLTVVSNGAATWVIERAGTLAAVVNPLTLQLLGNTQSISPVISVPLETADGTLWTVGDGGYVSSFAAGVRHSITRPADGRVTSLAEADSRPVVVDAAGRRYLVLDPATGGVSRSVSVNFPEPAAMAVVGSGTSPYVAAVGISDGDIQVTDINTHWSQTVGVGNVGDGFGTPVFSGDRIFVPDYEHDAVAVAQVVDDHLSLVGYVGVGVSHFDLLVYGGSVWFDDPATDVAGVITPDLNAYALDKLGGTGTGTKVGSLKKSLPVPTPFSSTGGGSNGRTAPHGTNAPPPPAGGPSPSPPTAAPSGGTSPVIGFTWFPATVYVGQKVTFSPTTRTAKVYQWIFPGGSPSAVNYVSSPSVRWSQPGVYTVELVTTEHGQSPPVASQAITVYATAAGNRPNTTTTPTSPTTKVTTPPTTKVTTPSTTKVTTKVTTPPTTKVTTPSTTKVTSPSCQGAPQTVQAGKTLANLRPPANCDLVSFDVKGAAGGSAIVNGAGATAAAGGKGAELQLKDYHVSSTDTFTIAAGGAGQSVTYNANVGGAGAAGAGGPNGGGAGGAAGISGGGGGMSYVEILTANSDCSKPPCFLLIAAGGGGAAVGAPGGSSGANGANGAGNEDGGISGQAGGAGGTTGFPNGRPGNPGAPLVGGVGGAALATGANLGGGGGGGSGLAGGGGGGGASSSGPSGSGTVDGPGGGGGGVDWTQMGGVTTQDGVNSGPGSVVITWSSSSAGGSQAASFKSQAASFKSSPALLPRNLVTLGGVLVLAAWDRRRRRRPETTRDRPGSS